MPAVRFRAGRALLAAAACLVLSAVSLNAQDVEVEVDAAAAAPPPVEVAPPFTPPPIQPTFWDWITARPIAQKKALAKTDPLLRPPFAGAPVDTPKGLAAKIKAVELDAANRIEAVQYLGTVDCVAFPEAQAMLIQVIQEDPFEPVRYEAVMALQLMLSRGAAVGGNPDCDCEGCEQRRELIEDVEKHAHKAKFKCPKDPCEFIHQCLPKLIHAPLHLPCKICARIKNGPAEAMRYDYCRGCCSDEALNALSAVAYGKDEFGCWLEPSARVRAAAAQALQLCPCVPVAPTLPGPPPEPLPPPAPPLEETPPTPPVEELPPTAARPVPLMQPPRPVQPASQVSSQGPSVGQQLEDAPVLTALNGYCIVAMRDRQFLRASPEYSAVHKGRTYYFSCQEALDAFEQDPRSYAPAYAGFDPVEYVRSREFREGVYLREYSGHFYLFASKDNWEAFLADPQRYALASDESLTAR